MEEKFYYCKEQAEKIETEMQKESNAAVKEQLAIQLFMAVANMGQIVISLMQSTQPGDFHRNPQEIVMEQAQKCEFIDVSLWKEFWRMRNILAHTRISEVIALEGFIQKIIPEFEKEFKMLS